MDGTGVAFLIRLRKELLNAGNQLVLLAPSASLRRVLKTMRLSDHFVVANDLAQAMRSAETIVASTVLQEGTTRSLAWCGEVIAANSEDVWQMTTDQIRAFIANETKLIIIDLARLRFIDSSGAALMLRLKRWAHSQSAEIIFANAQPNIRNVLRLSHLDQLLLEGSQ